MTQQLRETLDVSAGGQIAVGANGSVRVASPGQLLVDGLQVVGGQAANVAAIATPTGDEVTINAILEALQSARLMAQSAPTDLAYVQDPTDAQTDAVIAPPVTVQLLDDFGNPITGLDGTEITVALTTPGSATLGGTLTRGTVGGIATFDDLTVDTADTYTLDATEGAVGPVASAAFTISAP